MDASGQASEECAKKDFDGGQELWLAGRHSRSDFFTFYNYKLSIE